MEFPKLRSEEDPPNRTAYALFSFMALLLLLACLKSVAHFFTQEVIHESVKKECLKNEGK